MQDRKGLFTQSVSATMSAQACRTKLEGMARQWPKDALRPKLQFGQAISTATQRIFSSPLSSEQLQKAEATAESLHRLLQNSAMKEVRSLLHLRHPGILMKSRQHPMSERTLRPPSFPAHYDKLKEGIARIERGETSSSSWLGRLMGRP